MIVSKYFIGKIPLKLERMNTLLSEVKKKEKYILTPRLSINEQIE